MTVSSDNARAVHQTATGVDTYSFPSMVFNADEISVTVIRRNGAAGNIELILHADYEFIGLGESTGGAAVLTPAGQEKAGNGNNLVIVRDLQFKQEIRYEPGAIVPAATQERALDLAVMRDQQLMEMAARSLQAPLDAEQPISYDDFEKLHDETLKAAELFSDMTVAVETLPTGAEATGHYDHLTGTLELGMPRGEPGPPTELSNGEDWAETAKAITPKGAKTLNPDYAPLGTPFKTGRKWWDGRDEWCLMFDSGAMPNTTPAKDITLPVTGIDQITRAFDGWTLQGSTNIYVSLPATGSSSVAILYMKNTNQVRFVASVDMRSFNQSNTCIYYVLTP